MIQLFKILFMKINVFLTNRTQISNEVVLVVTTIMNINFIEI